MCHSEGLIFLPWSNTKLGLLGSIQTAVSVLPKPVQYLRGFAWRSAHCTFTNETMNTVILPAPPVHWFWWVVLHAEVVPGDSAEQMGVEGGMPHSGLGTPTSQRCQYGCWGWPLLWRCYGSGRTPCWMCVLWRCVKIVVRLPFRSPSSQNNLCSFKRKERFSLAHRLWTFSKKTQSLLRWQSQNCYEGNCGAGGPMFMEVITIALLCF